LGNLIRDGANVRVHRRLTCSSWYAFCNNNR
jgi:hypothetical protein